MQLKHLKQSSVILNFRITYRIKRPNHKLNMQYSVITNFTNPKDTSDNSKRAKIPKTTKIKNKKLF